MPTLYIMVGVPGSGKTTFAKKLSIARNAIHISSDDIRAELFGDATIQTNNTKVFNTMHTRIFGHLTFGANVIADATNISEWARKQIIELTPNGTKIVFVVMDTHLNESLSRNRLRDRYVPEQVIRNMWNKFQVPHEDEGGQVFFVNDEVIDDIP